MKAVLFHVHGGRDVLQYTDFPVPRPGVGEVLVKLKAAALNHLDLFVRQGWKGLKLSYPHIPGADGAGEVAALGEGITRWTVGERVVINANLGCGECSFCIAGQDNLCQTWELLGETRRGTYAEFVVVPERNLLALPNDFSEFVAAAAGLVYHSAWQSLVVKGRLLPGEKVLVVGASGGVNTACIDIAKLAGALVYVVGSGPEKLALAEAMGADFLIDRSQDENWAKTVYQMTDKRGVDVVVDNVGTTFPQSFRAARKGGRILTVGSSGGALIEIDNRFIFGKHLSLLGSSMGTRADFATVMQLVFSGQLKPALDITFPLAEAHLAQQKLEENKQLGKITLAIG